MFILKTLYFDFAYWSKKTNFVQFFRDHSNFFVLFSQPLFAEFSVFVVIKIISYNYLRSQFYDSKTHVYHIIISSWHFNSFLEKSIICYYVCQYLCQINYGQPTFKLVPTIKKSINCFKGKTSQNICCSQQNIVQKWLKFLNSSHLSWPPLFCT